MSFFGVVATDVSARRMREVLDASDDIIVKPTCVRNGRSMMEEQTEHGEPEVPCSHPESNWTYVSAVHGADGPPAMTFVRDWNVSAEKLGPR